jgi:protein SCO1/2
MLSVNIAASRPVAPEERIDPTAPLPKRLEGIDVVERLEGSVPKEAPFISAEGRPVRLGDYLDGTMPVILTLNYSSCPMLCSLQLNALVKGLKQVDWTIGKEFRIVTVVLDPKEPPARARETKARYVSEYGRPGAASGWHFLTGDEARIKEVARSVGISYGYNEKRDEYVHPAAIVMLTPEGRIARYLYGLEYHPKTVRLSLAEVGQGKVGSTVDRIILYCFHYDEKEGRYAPVAMNIMRLGAGVGAVLLGAFLATLWLAESRKKKKRAAAIGPAQSSET